MSRLSSSDQETPGQDSHESAPHRNGAAGASGNTDARDATGPQGSSTNPDSQSADGHEPSHLDRVEVLMDEIGKKVGSFTSQIGVHLFRWMAHGREAAEDCWAEAQSIRRGEAQEEKPEDISPTS
jgi:hypothetical protein